MVVATFVGTAEPLHFSG